VIRQRHTKVATCFSASAPTDTLGYSLLRIATAARTISPANAVTTV